MFIKPFRVFQPRQHEEHHLREEKVPVARCKPAPQIPLAFYLHPEYNIWHMSYVHKHNCGIQNECLSSEHQPSSQDLPTSGSFSSASLHVDLQGLRVDKDGCVLKSNLQEVKIHRMLGFPKYKNIVLQQKVVLSRVSSFYFL